MDLPAVLLWGFAGSTILTVILRSSQVIGLTRIDVPLMLGLIFTSDRDRAKAYGFLIHLANGWVFTFVYAAMFESLGRANVWLGMIFGFFHALFVLIVGLPALPGFHPRMATEGRGPEPTRELEPPGFMALNYGRGTPIATIIAHVAFGALLGGVYKVV